MFHMSSRSHVHVTLVRHGESESNRVKRWQGQGDSPLSGQGREQARLLGERLSRRRFDRVLSSDLSRAADTARATGFAFETHARLREFDVGVWEGLTREEVLERFPEDMEALAEGKDIPLGGGETHAAFAQRVDAAMDWACEGLEPGQHVLIVCHGGFIGAALAGALGLRQRQRWPFTRVGNTSITEIGWSADSKELRVFNDDLHVGALRMPREDGPDGARIGMAVPPTADGAEHLRSWFDEFGAVYAETGAHALPQWLAGRLDAALPQPPELSTLSAEERAETLQLWVSRLAERHGDGGAACLLEANALRHWVIELVWLGGSAPAQVSEPWPGSCARVRVQGASAVLEAYNADVRR